MRCQAGRFMRASAFALAIGLSIAPGRAAAPARIASLNLCTDELLIAMADPARILTLTHLSQDRRESAYWKRARAYRTNDGTVLSVASARPDLIVTMGGGGRDAARLATALGARFIDLPFPQRMDDVERGITQLAAALGRPEAARRLIDEMKGLARTTPRRRHDAIFVDSSQRSIASDGAGAQWLALAGLRQIALPGQRIGREHLLRLPPQTLVVSNYRRDQYSRSDALPLRRKQDRWIMTDGRRWTCMGPSLIPEIVRLRAALNQ